MNKRNIAVIIALIMAIPAIINGTSVIKGSFTPNQIILMWLVWYNVIFAFLSLGAAWLIWKRKGKRIANFIFSGHVLVLLALVGIYFISGEVAVKSIAAMSIRSVSWALILFLIKK